MKLRDALNMRESFVGANHRYNIVDDGVGRFFVVLRPNTDMELDDCLFETDLLGLANQIRGGLDEKEIYGFYTRGDIALRAAKKLLADIS